MHAVAPASPACPIARGTLHKVGSETGEKLWRMPLVPDYAEQVKSKIADMKNVGGRAGSSITAALFLKEFVEKVSGSMPDPESSWCGFDSLDAMNSPCLCAFDSNVTQCRANILLAQAQEHMT